MGCCDNRIPSVTSPHLDPTKMYASCGTWVGVKGFGFREVFVHLGFIHAPVTVWFERQYADDELNIYQFGTLLATVPEGVLKGSLTFYFDPYSDESGYDAIMLYFTNRHRLSTWSFRVDCPVEFYDQPILSAPSESTSKCGRYHHQAGYAKRNTIDLGTEPGAVYVTWSVQGSAIVEFYQGSKDNPIETIKSNRKGTFSFHFDPEKGDVYAITHGTGTVDYIFTCPYQAPAETEQKFEFTCGTQIHQFESPKTVGVILPAEIGNLAIQFTTEDTVVLKFYQRDILIYTVQQFAGSAEFSYDFDPIHGDIRIVSENYGKFSVSVGCPVPEVGPPDDGIAQYRLDCWEDISEFPAASDIEVVMPNEKGIVTVYYIVLGSTELIFTHGGVEVGHGYPSDGARSFLIDYLPSNGNIFVTARGSDPFHLAVECPVVDVPEFSATCGVTQEFLSPSNITIDLGAQSGNFQISGSLESALYKNNQLAGTLNQSTKTYLYEPGDVWRVSSYTTGSITIDSTCPSIKVLNCNSSDTFLAGDTVELAYGANRGLSTVEIISPDTIQLAWYFNGALIHSSEGNNIKVLNITDAGVLQIVSTGTGQFTISFPCPT